MEQQATHFLFGKEKLEALPPSDPGKRVTYHDTKTKGLQLRVTPAGAKTFCVFRRIKGGQPERVTLGKFPQMPVDEARKAAAAVLATIEAGANPAQAKRAHKKALTVDDLFLEFGRRHGRKKASWADDQQRYRDFLQKSLGKTKLSDVTRLEIAQALSAAENKGKSIATVRNIRALASVLFAKAVEWGYIEINPATGVKVSGAKVTRDRFLQAGELPAFFEALGEESSETMRDFILMALLTGARRANVCAMHWRDIDLSAGVWRIAVTKNGTPQNVTLSPEAVMILKVRHEATAGGYVFPGSGNSGHIEDPKKAMQRVMKEAGIPYGRKVENGVTLHDLRRTLGSWQARTGASLVIIGKTLNHKSQQATAGYARLDLDPVRQAVNTATAAMIKAAGLKEGAEVVPIKKGKTAA
jgi:integrase